MKKLTFIFVCLFVIGAGLRAANVRRAVDSTSWRESDIASIARNYVREGMNPFYPRVDWRGDGPGYTEMEFPLYPWLIAICYKVFGMHEVIGRILSLICSLLAMLFFFKLSGYLLPEKGALVASLFFVLSPLVISISSSLQPEGLMFLCYVLAAYYFVRWIDDESWKHYGLAMTATALALLAKASAAHIGLFFGILLITKIGLKALRQPRIWLFGAGALLPSIVWYKHAHNLWLTYGNSLGVSNETHWAGMDLFTNPTFILGIERAELFYVWMPTGVVLGLLALVMRSPTKAVRYSLYWLVAIEAFYLLAARTTSDSWATYYHVVSIPAVALMIGAGVDTVIQLRYQRSLLLALSIASIGLIVLLVITDLLSLSSFDMRLLFKLGALLGLSALMLIALFVGRTERESPSTSRFVRLNTAVIYFAIVCLAATSLYQIRMIRDDFQARAAEGSLFACSHQFAPAIPADVLIAASGGACVDPTGFPVAFNSSYMFYWLDRKGFSICIEKQSIAALKLLADRGARYFVAEKSAVKMKPGFDVELQMSFPLIMECKDAYLFQIQPPPSGTRTGNK